MTLRDVLDKLEINTENLTDKELNKRIFVHEATMDNFTEPFDVVIDSDGDILIEI